MKSKNKFLSSLVMFLSLALDFYIVRPVKAIGKALTAFSNAMGAPGGLLANTWTANQNADAPVSSGTQTVAISATTVLAAECGKITITGLNAAAGAFNVATITNTTILATSRIVATLNSYTGVWATNGEPCLVEVTIAANTMVFRIKNLHAANALAGNCVISYEVGQVIV